MQGRQTSLGNGRSVHSSEEGCEHNGIDDQLCERPIGFIKIVKVVEDISATNGYTIDDTIDRLNKLLRQLCMRLNLLQGGENKRPTMFFRINPNLLCVLLGNLLLPLSLWINRRYMRNKRTI